MKNRILLIIFITLLMLPMHIHAQEKEAGATAQLISFQPIADPRVQKLQAYLAAQDSPATFAAEHFVRYADEFNLDWKFVAAIAGLESTYCKHTPTLSYNCWGWGIPTGAQSGIGFTSIPDGIYKVSSGLRNNYINKGLMTVEQIGSVYAASPTWASRVRYIMGQIETFSDPNAPAPIAMNL